jgi:acetylornithine deacetylase/succinyl-diaminopimelate desuccinylase-like protein
MTTIEQLLIDMLKIPSVSGFEKDMGEYLNTILSPVFSVKKQRVAKDRYNIIATKGRPDIYIVVHMDTVPGEVPVRVTQNRIYGRGAIDNKGNIAGAIMVARSLDNIGLIFTVGEEVNFIGAKKSPKPKGKVIVMEPTQMRVAIAQRGVIGLEITARGTQQHSSLPFKKSESAVYVLTHFLMDLYKKNWTAFNAIITNGGVVENIVAPYASTEILIRPKDVMEYRTIMRFVENCKRKNIALTKVLDVPPHKSTLLPKGDAVGYFSEMAFFDNSILFGVGNISNAHTSHEHVLRKDLNALEDALRTLIGQLRAL